MEIEYERFEARLSDGTIVLGKISGDEVCAKTYANRTQAKKAASREPGGVVIQRGRPFYVLLRRAHEVTPRLLDAIPHAARV